jgi:hypothetical protein
VVAVDAELSAINALGRRAGLVLRLRHHDVLDQQTPALVGGTDVRMGGFY